jgi:hypothetical protein
MPRTPFDEHAKEVALDALRPFGKAEADARITAETQFADLRFVRGTRSRDGYDDLLTRALQPRMLYEFAHAPPDIATVVSWHVKRDVWFLSLCREARRKKRPAPSLPSVLVALSAGDPLEVRRAYRWAEPVTPGVYEGDPSGTFRLVVISQLPETLDTLRVRTMGAGATLARAIREVQSLPSRSKLRTMLSTRIAMLRVALEGDPSPEAQEFVMEAEKIYNRRLHQQRRQGVLEGRQEGLRAAIAQVFETRSLGLTPAQRAALEATTDEEVLGRWLTRAATARSAREVFAQP